MFKVHEPKDRIQQRALRHGLKCILVMIKYHGLVGKSEEETVRFYISGLPDIDLPLNQFWESWKTPSKVGDLADSLHLECTLSIMRVYLGPRPCGSVRKNYEPPKERTWHGAKKKPLLDTWEAKWETWSKEMMPFLETLELQQGKWCGIPAFAPRSHSWRYMYPGSMWLQGYVRINFHRFTQFYHGFLDPNDANRTVFQTKNLQPSKKNWFCPRTEQWVTLQHVLSLIDIENWARPGRWWVRRCLVSQQNLGSCDSDGEVAWGKEIWTSFLNT